MDNENQDKQRAKEVIDLAMDLMKFLVERESTHFASCTASLLIAAYSCTRSNGLSSKDVFLAMAADAWDMSSNVRIKLHPPTIN